NLMNGVPLLGNSAIDFVTGGDVDGPDVVMATPAEGSLDVDIDVTTSIEVVWNEAMDTSITSAQLDAGARPFTLDTGRWSNGGRTLSFDVTGALQPTGPHRLDLRGMRDAAGNPALEDGYLGNGWLDFVMGQDASAPEVVYTN